MLTQDKITTIFCITDEFYKKFAVEFQNQPKLPQADRVSRNRSGQLSESEIMTILILYHFGQFKNFKAYYLHYIQIHLKKEFPNAVSYSRFIQIEHKVFIPVMYFLNMARFGRCTGITFVDSTKIAVCHTKRITRNKVFQDIAKLGKSSIVRLRSLTVGWFYGFKLHFACNDRGEILSFCLTSGNVDDRDTDTIKTLTKKLYGSLFADKGYVSQSLFEMLFNDGVHIVTGIRSNMKNRLMPLRDKILLRKRSVTCAERSRSIETINDMLKNICDVEHTRHRSVHNFIMNLISALAAYTFFDKKPAIKVEWEEPNGQLSLFI